MARKTKKSKWFVPVRGSYLPNNWMGWLTYLPFVAYLVFSVFFAWQYTDNNAQGLLLVVPNWIAATAIMTWVAKRTS